MEVARPADGPADQAPVVDLTSSTSWFRVSSALQLGASPYYDLRSLDVNRDGRLDLVWTSTPAHSLLVSLGLGDGRLSPPVTTGGVAQGLALGDLDGDGIVDALVGGGGVASLRGAGDGSFSQLEVVGASDGADHPRLGDVDRDGRPDLVATVSSPDAVVSLYTGSGNGRFGPANLFGNFGGEAPWDLALADLDADGHLDVLLSFARRKALGLLLGRGGTQFGADVGGVEASSPRSALAVHDVNGDGVLDVVTGTISPDGLAVYYGVGGGSFGAAHFVAARHGVGRFDVADFNRDGLADVVVGHSDGVQFFATDGKGDLREVVAAALPCEPGCFVAAGDFNGDARPDLAVSSGGTLSIHLNQLQ